MKASYGLFALGVLNQSRPEPDLALAEKYVLS